MARHECSSHRSHYPVPLSLLSQPSLYSTTVSQALRQTLRGKGLNNIDPHHQPRAHGGPGDREVRDKSLLTSFNIDGERFLNTPSETAQSLSNGLRGYSNGGYSRTLTRVCRPSTLTCFQTLASTISYR